MATSDVQRTPSPRLETSFQRSPFKSIKHSSYFSVYDILLAPYLGYSPTLVEIGVLDGGSLFMWRDYFGPGARIIGIDLNDEALKWRDYGFEIAIGDQGDPRFWHDLLKSVPSIDLVIDDGGHTNTQQLTTVLSCLPHINDGGMIVVEDAHASYMNEFGNPSRSSFVSMTHRFIDAINTRSELVDVQGPHLLAEQVYSIEFFESIVAIKVNRPLCQPSHEVTNKDHPTRSSDLRAPNNGAVTRRYSGPSARRILPAFLWRQYRAMKLHNHRVKHRWRSIASEKNPDPASYSTGRRQPLNEP